MMNNPERAERVGAFYRLIENSDLVSISCKINISDLNKAKIVFGYSAIELIGHYTDPFFFTFRALINCVHSHRRTMPSLPQDDKIDFIFDDQSQKSMIISAWDKFLENRDPAVREMFGANIKFENDREFLPLQAADLWAWWTRQWYGRMSY